MSDPVALAARIASGDRAALARAITLVESTRPADRAGARELLAALWPRTGGALRIGLTGAPGVGKSTFADGLGLHVLAQGHRLAVLAVDPSSIRDSGAILGDKTRMARLAGREEAFIRPSPGGGGVGGVALRTQEAVCLCEAAGYDVVMVETIGVGQSESAVASMTDLFVLLIAPGGGDHLQGVKRGVMELADLLLVNKCDGRLAEAAQHTRSEYAAALTLQRPRPGDPEGVPAVLGISALEETGIEEVWERIHALDSWRREQGHHQARRRAQLRSWVRTAVTEELLGKLGAAGPDAVPPEIGRRLDEGSLDPGAAADEILKVLSG